MSAACALKVVQADPVVCWPWHLWFLIARVGGHPRGGACCECARDVAVQAHNTNPRAMCIYCAMDAGLVPELDAPFGDGDGNEDPVSRALPTPKPGGEE